MAVNDELERINQAQGYINRYYEFTDAIKINKENREYLKTYIHDESYVEKEFNLKSHIVKAVGLGLGAGVLLFVIFLAMLGTDVIIVPIIAGIVGLVALTVFFICLQHFRLTEAKKKQVEVNDGITEQLEILKSRDEQLVRQRDDYYNALQKRIDFMPLDYMKNIDQLKEYIESGEAQTCEDAVEILERNMLLAQMNTLTSKTDDIEEAVNIDAAKERLGDPLEMIKKNKKKKKKEKAKKSK